jgi:sRNA-binding regulator protein Hfq
MAYVVKLQGHVAYFDSDCIILRRDRHPQLVERHAISTVMSGKARRSWRSWRRRSASTSDFHVN